MKLFDWFRSGESKVELVPKTTTKGMPEPKRSVFSDASSAEIHTNYEDEFQAASPRHIAHLEQHIDEPVDRVFLPEAQAHKPTPGSEVFIDLEDDDFPDHIDGPEVDLSALLIETLALAIDPYPRAPGESLDSLGIDVGGGPMSPFAALEKLKKSTDIDR